MADSIKIGNLDISAFKVGSSDCKVYLGDTLLYPTAPPSFQGKWLATYNGGTTSSAECDASSAITQNEIALSNLVEVEIGDCVTSIGEAAFYECSSLTSIDIPDSVTTIGTYAFYNCSSLTSIVIPSGVTSIGQSAFYNCSSLTSCTIGSGVTSIGTSAFRNCSGLTSIDIPSDVTSIGNQAFYACSSLTSCTIGSGVTSIGDAVFYRCSGLTSIISNAATPPTLGSYVFDNTNDCPIYVPSASVNAYKAATNWSTYASRIQAIPS